MARPVRFELTTPCSGGMYSIHLSYGRVPKSLAQVTSPRTRAGAAFPLSRFSTRIQRKSRVYSLLSPLQGS